MRRLLKILFFILAFGPLCNTVSANHTEELLKKLDKAVADKEQLADTRRRNISKSLSELAQVSADTDRYNIYRTLYSQYRSYMGDSARWVAEKRMDVASRIGDSSKIRSALLNLAESYSLGGDNHQALAILDTMTRRDLPLYQRKYMYSLYRTIYERMAQTDGIQSNVLLYEQRQRAYLDSALTIMGESDPDYNLTKGRMLILSGHPSEALPFLDKSLAVADSKYMSRLLTVKAYALSKLNRRDEEMDALAQAALLDLTAGQRDYTALPHLALLLLERGDTDRAYNYIRCALDDARLCNAKARTAEILELIPAIDASYAQARDRQITILCISFTLLAFMAIALVISLYYLRKKNKNIKVYNSLLHEANSRLSESNHLLEEANKAKLQYLAEVFNAHSGYISRMATYRASMLKFLTAGQPAKARKLLESDELNESELKEFYSRFDSIFLKMFPDFIEQYNKIAKPEYAINAKSKSLSSELRVLALMKIGIMRSARIAELLHYSPQTVYNYKSALRASVTLPKEQFDAWIENNSGAPMST